jgi:hypothetical protein
MNADGRGWTLMDADKTEGSGSVLIDTVQQLDRLTMPGDSVLQRIHGLHLRPSAFICVHLRLLARKNTRQSDSY